ncbi:MAG TPA: MOSC N-terminal beta barrel domain-containing protein, partial [Pseudonocardia sp.]|nr:MOSC N-terminal beta barrel domain-containing protein [Pseudonocardia sp.]
MNTEQVGTIVELWRFPVKSMLGERVEAAVVTEAGIVGDRGHALIDRQTGKVASAKHPRLWPDLFGCRARYVEPPQLGRLPP